MAKRKVVTKKETTKESGELDLTPLVDEVVNIEIDSSEGAGDDLKIYGKTVSPPPSKEDLQDHYDQEVKDLLKEMGNIQSRYQQLGRTNKAKSLRNQKRIIQGLYKEWK